MNRIWGYKSGLQLQELLQKHLYNSLLHVYCIARPVFGYSQSNCSFKWLPYKKDR